MYKTLIIFDGEDLALDEQFPAVTSFQTYLREYPKLNESKTRIINLCDTEHYLSKGYYCSLLAEARNHVVLPSIKTINDLRNFQADREVLSLLGSLFAADKMNPEQTECMIYFGRTAYEPLQKFAKAIFQQYASPILKLSIQGQGAERALHIESRSLSALDQQQRSEFIQSLSSYMDNNWRIGRQKKHHRWEMAILVNPEEAVPPSDKEAIAHFIKAASKQGIRAEAVTSKELTNLDHYDALFIRETTAIDHPTYRLACRAEKSGLVVMDDPVSILRCCNKVYLHDAFSYQKVPSLRTEVVDNAHDETLDKLEQLFNYPLVLKMPEGSFSKGVYKINTREELHEKLSVLLEDSALVLAQEFLYTDFDWRIGVLNGRAIYACRYKMARNHWQIYNHQAKQRYVSGGFETFATFEVPKAVLAAALKAAHCIGNGLYGVDIKEAQGKVYVLEVNDNPSLDHGVENAYVGNELYMQIMGEFQRRLEARGR